MNLSVADKSAKLRHFADQELCPSQPHTKNGQKFADEIFRELRRGVKYIDRVIIGGSMGKRTGVGDDTDFDLVVFCNDKHPPHKRVLEDFGGILSRIEGIEIKRTNDYIIQFEKDGFSFDLCPATNFVPESNISGPEKRRLQKERTLEKMSTLSGPRRQDYSTSLAEAAVEFLKIQSAFVHSVARLAKYWNTGVHGQGYFPGSKLLVETLAVEAAREAEDANLPILDAFTVFLKTMKRLSANSKVRDPANPFNDITDGAKINFTAFHHAAQHTLDNLDKIGSMRMSEIMHAPTSTSRCALV